MMNTPQSDFPMASTKHLSHAFGEVGYVWHPNTIYILFFRYNVFAIHNQHHNQIKYGHFLFVRSKLTQSQIMNKHFLVNQIMVSRRKIVYVYFRKRISLGKVRKFDFLKRFAIHSISNSIRPHLPTSSCHELNSILLPQLFLRLSFLPCLFILSADPQFLWCWSVSM